MDYSAFGAGGGGSELALPYHSPNRSLAYMWRCMTRIVERLPWMLLRVVPRWALASLGGCGGGPCLLKPRDAVTLLEALKSFGDTDPTLTLGHLRNRGLFTIEDIRKMRELDFTALLTGIPTIHSSLSALRQLYRSVHPSAKPVAGSLESTASIPSPKALPSNNEAWVTSDITLQVTLDNGSQFTILAERNTSYDEVLREITSKCRLNPSQEARLVLAGLELSCGGRSYGPVTNASEWVEMVRALPNGPLLRGWIRPAPIDFDTVEYAIANSKAATGAYGSIYRCMHLASGFVFGAKVIPHAAGQSLKELVHEVNVMSRLSHENIVTYFGAQHIPDPGQSHLRIFMEYCPSGSLKQVLTEFDRLPESLVQQFTQQMLKALSYLHLNNVIHRDLKPDNVLLSVQSRLLKLCDFGISVELPPNATEFSTTNLLGTPAFMSPEAICEGRYSHKSDVWACACTVLAMLVGDKALYTHMTSPMALLYNVGHRGLKPNIPLWCSGSTIDFLEKCFTSDWKQRPDATELLEHEFIVQPIARSGSPSHAEGFGSSSCAMLPTATPLNQCPPLPPITVSRTTVNWTNTDDVISADAVAASASNPSASTAVRRSFTATFTTAATSVVSDWFTSSSVVVPRTGFAPLEDCGCKHTGGRGRRRATSPPKQRQQASRYRPLRLPPVQTSAWGIQPRSGRYRYPMRYAQDPAATSSVATPPSALIEAPEVLTTTTPPHVERVPGSMDEIFTYLGTEIGKQMLVPTVYLVPSNELLSAAGEWGRKQSRELMAQAEQSCQMMTRAACLLASARCCPLTSSSSSCGVQPIAPNSTTPRPRGGVSPRRQHLRQQLSNNGGQCHLFSRFKGQPSERLGIKVLRTVSSGC